MAPKIDTHHHFWQYRSEEYAWIDDSMAVLKRDFLPEDLQPLLAQLDFNGSVVVQARQTEEETAWLLQLADRYEFINGVVGWVNLCSDDLDLQLERYSTHKKFSGVRHVLQDEPDENFMLRKDFQRGIGKLAKYGLAYDILIFRGQLPVATQLVRNFPGQVFVLDHMAKPQIRKQEVQPWKQHMEELAAFPNVACKISGMVTEADWYGWKANDFRPYMDAVVNAFGISRVMIGSDWPVCTLAGKYGEVMGMAMNYIRQFSQCEREMILGVNAERVYSLSGKKSSK
jgi:L-fuconolactonase